MSRRTHPMVTWLVVTLIACGGVFSALSAGDATARGFRRSHFRSSRRSWGSSSRRRSTYRPSRRRRAPTRVRPSRPTSFGRSAPARRSTGTRYRSSRGSSTARRLYRASQARRYAPRRGRRMRRGGYGMRPNRAYRRAAAAGLAFATYALARDHFYRTRLTRFPVAFTAQPASRPSYIPKTSTVNGELRPVVWADGLHSYAVKKQGKLAPYDLHSDKVATSTIMATQGYVWGPRPTTSRARSSGGGWFWLVALGLGVAVFLVMLLIAFFVLRAIKRSLIGPSTKTKTKTVAVTRQPLLAPPGIRHDEPSHPDFWMQLSIGDFVVIHDFQAFEDALDGPKGVTYGDDFRVASLVRLHSATHTWDAVLTELAQTGQQSLYLLAWRERGATQLSVYYAPTGFAPGTRTELLSRDEVWLFQEPTRDDWRPGELTFNTEVTHVGTGADGSETEQAFMVLPGGAAAAAATREPTPGTLEAATVVRWRCAAAPKNPLMLLLELGAGADMAGGHLQLWLGTPIEAGEIEITPNQIRT